MQELFHEIDADQSGAIDVLELGECLRGRGFTLSQEVVTRLVRYADKDGDGMLDVEEFQSVMQRASRAY